MSRIEAHFDDGQWWAEIPDDTGNRMIVSTPDGPAVKCWLPDRVEWVPMQRVAPLTNGGGE